MRHWICFFLSALVSALILVFGIDLLGQPPEQSTELVQPVAP